MEKVKIAFVDAARLSLFIAFAFLIFSSMPSAVGKPSAPNGVELLIQANQTYGFYYGGEEFATARLLNKLTPGGPDGKPFIECQSEVWCAVDLEVTVKKSSYPGQDAKWFKGRFLEDRHGKSKFDSFLVKDTQYWTSNRTVVSYSKEQRFNSSTAKFEWVEVENRQTTQENHSRTTYRTLQPSDLDIGNTIAVRFVFYRPWNRELVSDLSFNLFGFDFDFLAWWNTAWNAKLEYYQIFTLGEDAGETVLPVNFSTTTLVGRQVLSPDLNASRFINASEDTSKDYYIENSTNNTGNTVYWVKEPYVNNGNNTGYFYYNNNATTTDVEADPYSSDTGVKIWLDMSDRTPNPVNRMRTDSNLTCGSQPGVVTGALGNASNFTSASYTCTQSLATSNYMTGNNTFTWEFVMRKNADYQTGGGCAYIAGAYDVGGGNICWLSNSNASCLNSNFYDGTSHQTYQCGTIGAWEHWVLKSYGSTTPYTYEVWQNAVLQSTGTWNGVPSTAFTIRWLGGATGSQVISYDSIYISNQNKSNAWITARYNAMVKNAWVFGGEQQLTESISITSPTPANQSILNVSYAYINATGQTTGGANSYCFIQIYNSSGLYAKNISTTVSGTYFDCFLNQTNAIGNQTFNVTIVGGSNSTTANRNYNLPQYRVRTFSEDDGSPIASTLVISNGTTTSTFNNSQTVYVFHYELVNPTSIEVSASGYQSRTFAVSVPTNFTTYDLYLPPSSGVLLYTFLVRTPAGAQIGDATLTFQKILNGSLVNVTSPISCDASGTCVVYLTLGDSYTIFAYSPTYGSGTVAFTATTTTTSTITIGAVSATPGYSSDYLGIRFDFKPNTYLYNDTYYSLNVTTSASLYWRVNFTLINWCVYWSNNTLVRCVNSTNYQGASLNVSFTVNKDDYVYGIFNFTGQSDGTNMSFEQRRYWAIVTTSFNPQATNNPFSRISLDNGLRSLKTALGGGDAWWALLIFSILAGAGLSIYMGLGATAGGLVVMSTIGIVMISTGFIPVQIFGLIVFAVLALAFYFRVF